MVFSLSSRISTENLSRVRLLSDSLPPENKLTPLASKYLAVERNLRAIVRKVHYQDLLHNRFQLVEGVMWCSCWIWSLYDFCTHAWLYKRIAGLDLTQTENRTKLHTEAKQTFIKLISWSGMSASTLQWADRVRIIAMGALAPFVQKFSYATFLISSGFGIEKAIETLQKTRKNHESEPNPAAKNVHKHHYRLALIDLASHISTVAWVVLGIIEIAAGVTLSPLLTGSVFMIGCAFASVSLGYSFYIAYKVEPNTPLQPSVPTP